MWIRRVPYGSPSIGRLVQITESNKEEVSPDIAIGTGDEDILDSNADNDPLIDEVEVIRGDGIADEVVILTLVQLPQVTTVTQSSQGDSDKVTPSLPVQPAN